MQTQNQRVLNILLKLSILKKKKFVKIGKKDIKDLIFE